MNRFLLSYPIVSIRSQWVTRGEIPYQVFTVEYIPGKAAQLGLATLPSSQATTRIDYKQVLSPEAFIRYCKLRDERKKIADEEAVKAFVIFTNAQMAALAQMDQPSLAEMKKIEGIGDVRIEKYGERMLAVLKESESLPVSTETELPLNDEVFTA